MPLRKVSRCHQDLITIIYKVADKLNLCDIEYVIEFGCEDIDVFLTGVYKVCIKGVRGGQKIKYSAIVKWHGDEKQRNSLRALYHRDYTFLELIVPEFLNFQRQFKAAEGLKTKFNNCIFASIERDKESIVLLPDIEFKCLHRLRNIDIGHATLVIKNLAKLHALSFALETKKPRTFETIKMVYNKDIQYSNPNSVSQSMNYYYNASVSAVSEPIAKEKLKLLAPNILQVLNKCTLPGAYSAICHGDCWSNNIFYKYKMGKPIDVLFIDYQLSRLASPVTDLSYFFYMTSDKDYLVKYYDRLLAIYYGTLTAVLRQCDLNVEEVYPKCIFEKHLKNYSAFGLIEALVSMKIITAPEEEAFKMTEVYHFEDGFIEDESQNHSLYVERVNGIVDDFFERGYSLDSLLNGK